MPRVLVTGGTGELGSELVPRFAAAGYAVRILSRKPRAASTDSKYEWAQGDLVAGEGIAEALAGVDLVVHAATNPPTGKGDPEGTRSLCAAAKEAGTPHLFYISIVGVDKIPMPYYKAKLACEKVLEESGAPWTILRAVQFHSLIDYFLTVLTRAPVLLPLARDFKFQPMDTGEVAARMVDYAASGPSGRLPDLGGPEFLTLGGMARSWAKARGKREVIVPLPVFGKIATGFHKGYNCVPDNPQGTITWEQWLQAKYRR